MSGTKLIKITWDKKEFIWKINGEKKEKERENKLFI